MVRDDGSLSGGGGGGGGRGDGVGRGGGGGGSGGGGGGDGCGDDEAESYLYLVPQVERERANFASVQNSRQGRAGCCAVMQEQVASLKGHDTLHSKV